jgi:catechol 2,3-dioxygenase-like lactoylglutathione lyase family enzyme
MFKHSRLTIRVADLDTSVAFYTEKLGFQLIRRLGQRSAAFEAADNKILLLQKFEGQPHVTAAAPISFGLFVDDLDGAIETLRGRGVEFEGEPVDMPEFRIAFFSDPDGTPLYLAQVNESLEDWATE